ALAIYAESSGYETLRRRMRRRLPWHPPQEAGGRPRGLRSRCARRARGWKRSIRRCTEPGPACEPARHARPARASCKAQAPSQPPRRSPAPRVLGFRARPEGVCLPGAAAAARFGGTQPSMQVHQFHRILVLTPRELVLEGGEWDQPEATEEIDHEVSG